MTAEEDWQRLDPRMLLVYPVRELVRFLPVLIGIFIAGTASGRTDWWHGIGVLFPMALGVLRYFTTDYRITESRVELRRGLLDRHHLSTPLDRVRTVDVTASLTHRALGVATVRIGTGTASKDDEDNLDLDGLPTARARTLRAELLHRGGTSAEEVEADRVVLRFDPSWVRFAPLTTTGLVLAGPPSASRPRASTSSAASSASIRARWWTAPQVGRPPSRSRSGWSSCSSRSPCWRSAATSSPTGASP